MKTLHAKAILGAISIMLGSAMLPAAPAFAQQKYPTRPIRLLIPFPAGGAADTIGRSMGIELAAQLGQSVVVDNRPGAGGRLAHEMLANATPDGYTLLIGMAGPVCISPTLYRNLAYKPARDLLPITRVAEIVNVMVVHPRTGVKTVKEFVPWAKTYRGDIRFGSSGTGQPDHLAAELFQRVAGIKMLHVPYKGGGPALIDLLSGDLQVMFPTYVVAVPHAKAGRLRIIAVVSPKRQPLLPELPAVSETAPGFGLINWNGVFVPAKTPKPIADRLFIEINKAILHPAVKRRQNAAGIQPGGSQSQQEFAQFVAEETKRWAKVIKDANIRVE